MHVLFKVDLGMKPPKAYRLSTKAGFSICIACRKWKFSNMLFFHEGINWVLCAADYADYWYNTDELLSDYKGY